MFGTLFIVATPIGNLDDITLRALKVLKEVELILVEDSRQTSKLLKYFEIDTSVKSYHQHSSDKIKQEILLMLLSGKNLGLVTDAGTPGISDPGNELIDYLLSKEPSIPIIPIPGASGLATAISISGFDMSRFTFIGFMPKKKQNKLFSTLMEAKMPFVYFDSPHRLLKNLENIRGYFGEVTVFVARELTKIHEETYRGTISDVILNLQASNPKGEVVVIVKI